jgi:hypothetical protein
MIKHTPSPWVIEYGTHDGYDCMTGAFTVKAGEQCIAKVDQTDYGQPHCDYEFKSELAETNTHLIAAAPELLEALEALCIETEDYMRINNLGNPEEKHNIKMARAAIAKAKGY